MHRALTLIVMLLVACALAAPAPAPRSLAKRSFKVATRGRSTENRNGKAEMLKAARKFNWEIVLVNPATGQSSTIHPSAGTTTITIPAATSAVANAASSNGSTPAGAPAPSGSATSGQTGQVSADPEADDAEYIENVTVGGQKLTMDFDTGSSDMWVFNQNLPTSEIAGHTTFDTTKSKTFQPLQGATFDISYGDGSGASGTVGHDVVNIGGATVTKQAVEIATAVSSSFISDTKNDGLVGLAFDNINTVKPQSQKTFFFNAMDSLAMPVFTADLQAGAKGTYEFGTIDASKHTGNITYTAVDSSNGFWQFDSKKFAVGGNSTSNANANPAIADTGTSLLLVDPNVATAYYAQVKGATNDANAGGFVYPCTAKLPDMSVAVGSNYMATVKGADLTFAKVDSTNCFGGVQSNGGTNIQIYGDVLLKSQFVVFDGGNTRIGMAPKPVS